MNGTLPELLCFREGDGCVTHTVRKTPFVVIPRNHADKIATNNLCLGQVKHRAERAMIEIDRYEGLIIGAENAFQRRLF